MKTISISHS